MPLRKLQLKVLSKVQMKDNNSIADEVGDSRDKVTEVGAEEALEVNEKGEYESADEATDKSTDGVIILFMLKLMLS